MWKGLLAVLFLAFLLLLSGGPLGHSATASSFWYVSPAGSDASGAGSPEAPFRTVQRAIDAARDGDQVVVLEGRYAGPGNADLDFRGKAVLVRSRDPEKDAVLRRTILDATGQGVVARFERGEGPGSGLAGFTLIAGDPTRPARGVPGFFAFSPDARPALRRLRIAAGSAPPAPAFAVQSQIAGAGGPAAWKGRNPFHQPAATTDYYGSGDADLDGRVGAADVKLARRIARGELPPNRRMDVDGDGRVDQNDVRLLAGTLTGGVLPAWWDRLDRRVDREAWIDRMMALDATDRHTYAYWWQCLSFAVQTFIHGAFYREDLSGTLYDGGPTELNLPLYYVSVHGPSFGHGIDAVLVGDDPLAFADWRFLEPQTDQNAAPGMWDMPYGTEVEILVPEVLLEGGFSYTAPLVRFRIGETGPVLIGYRADLRLQRGEPPSRVTDNATDLWHPRIVPVGPPRVLFERVRDGMAGGTDLHLADVPLAGLRPGTPLVPAARYARLLDVARGADGAIHLLWTAETRGVPGVFYGRLDLQGRRIVESRRVSAGMRSVRMGRLAVTAAGDVHVFWLEVKSNWSHPYESGIYWNRREGGAWGSPELLVPFAGAIPVDSYYSGRPLLDYTFDVVADPNGILLAWIDPYAPGEAGLYTRRLTAAWSEPETLGTGSFRGVALARDTAGTLHLFDWTGGPEIGSFWGDLRHRASADGVSWTSPETLDGPACCVSAAAGRGGALEAVWERRAGERSTPVRRRLTASWSGDLDLGVPGQDVRTPTIAVLPTGRIVIAWSSRTAHGTGVEARAFPWASN